MNSKERCQECGGRLIERRATVDKPYQFKMSGLSNVYLAGIVIRKCTSCPAESPIIPRIGRLNGLIARDLVNKNTLLDGGEIRFLRKNAGIPAKVFAELVGIDPKHLSRIENGHTENLGTPADRLARIISMATAENVPHPRYLELMRELADACIEAKKKSKKPRAKKPVFELRKDSWKRAA